VRRIDARYALWGLGGIVLAAIPALAGFTGLGWELSQMAGLAGALACIALCGAPVRARNATPPTLLSLHLHTLIGWSALIAVVLHIGGLVLADRTVVEYLKPTTPLYQLAGILAACLLLVVVLSSLAGVRRRLWASHRGFQATHVILGCALAALVAVHVVVTARYLGGPGRRALYVAVTIGAILMLLQARRPNDGVARESRGRRQLVFGRHSSLIVGVVAIACAALAALFPDAVGAALREPLLTRANTIPLDFPHGKHGMVNCLTCHHNYADGRGWDACVRCHRSSRPDLKEGAEARFHGFCFECHRNPDATFKRHGPVSGCTVCHQPPGTTIQGDTPMR
jgi:class III cytochrome C family protein/ferric reductase like protein